MTTEDMNPMNTAQTETGVSAFQVVENIITEEEIAKANLTLQKYKSGKANLERRIIENEQWFKIRNWECMREKEKAVQPNSAWLFNAIANKHADSMDNFPSANIVPREKTDKEEAEILSAVIPVILDEGNFEKTYSSEQWYKLKFGTGVYGIFWDTSAANGMGDISVRKCNLLNLFWEPGIEDIQLSSNFFSVELCDNDKLIAMYPQLEGKLGGKELTVAEYSYDDTVDTTDKSIVVDWYYKKKNGEGKTVLHFCKYCGNTILYSSENEEAYRERGFYDHGKYPFVFDVLFETEGTPTGFGYIDVGKDCQGYIDRANSAILENMLVLSRPRYFIRQDGSVNQKEFADMSNNFIHVDGNLGQDSILQVTGHSLDSVYVNVLSAKIQELKETTGNGDVSTGGTTSGVTAASAIAAVQEAASKLSRDQNKAAYRAFREVVVLCIELIRQFYDLPRFFRVLGADGTERFVQYSNQGIIPKYQGVEFGVDTGYRIPLFDVDVTAQKQSPYSKMSQNELALQFYNAGFFNPQMADQATACLSMMDFDRKDMVIDTIKQNGTMMETIMMQQQQMLMLAQMVDESRGTNLAEQVASAVTGKAPSGGGGASGEADAEALKGYSGMAVGMDALGDARADESKKMASVRRETAERATPR